MKNRGKKRGFQNLTFLITYQYKDIAWIRKKYWITCWKTTRFLMDTFLFAKTLYILLFCALLYDIISFSFTYINYAVSCFMVIGISSCRCAATSLITCEQEIFFEGEVLCTLFVILQLKIFDRAIIESWAYIDFNFDMLY